MKKDKLDQLISIKKKEWKITLILLGITASILSAIAIGIIMIPITNIMDMVVFTVVFISCITAIIVFLCHVTYSEIFD